MSAQTFERIVDRDGDEWERKPDGLWCCQTPCPTHGKHKCSEHDHYEYAKLVSLFGPVAAAGAQTTGGTADD